MESSLMRFFLVTIYIQEYNIFQQSFEPPQQQHIYTFGNNLAFSISDQSYSQKIRKQIKKEDSNPYKEQCLPQSIFVNNDSDIENFQCPIGLRFKTYNTNFYSQGIINIENSVQDEHGHVFCKPCLFKWLEMKKTCPVTNSNIEFEKVVPIQGVIKDYLGEKKVYCFCNDQGCEWIGQLKNLFFHYDNDCEYVPVNCPNTKCLHSCKRKVLDEHLLSCPYGETQCEFCGQTFLRIQIKEHESTCDQIIVQCKTNCGASFKKAEENQHEVVCPLVQCKFCKQIVNFYFFYVSQIPKKQLESHNIKEINNHLEKILSLHTRLQTIETDLNQENKKISKSTSFLLRKTGTFQFGESCIQCGHQFKQPNSKDGQYYCKACDSYYCEDCVDMQHLHKNEHQHYLIYIKVDKISNERIQEVNFGHNIFPENQLIAQKIYHRMQCNGCGKSYSEERKPAIRFVCLNCQTRPHPNSEGKNLIDFCDACIGKFRNRDMSPSKFQQLVINNENYPLHDFNSHIYLRIPFAHYEYCQF